MSETADLSNCDTTPIHVPEAIQSFGALLAARRSDFRVIRASVNLHTVLGTDPASALGCDLRDLIGPEAAAALEQALAHGTLHAVSPGTIASPSGNHCNVAYHFVNDVLIAELEPVVAARPETENRFTGELPYQEIHKCRSTDELARLLATEMRRLTGFDRAIVYRFDEDWHGEVIAEDKNGIYGHSFLGHHFPATDIPAPARNLFTLNRLRVIPDAGYQPVPLLPQGGQQPPLDMTFCSLRDVAEVHREYMRNMDVGASITVSLLNEGQLWGMVTCHCVKPHTLPMPVRLYCKGLAELASFAVADLVRREENQVRREREQQLRQVQDLLAGSADFRDGVQTASRHILATLDADGLVLRHDGMTIELGAGAPGGALELARSVLEKERRERLAYSRNLSRLDQRLASAAPLLSGALLCRLGDQGSDFLAFRREIVEARQWAGNPVKPQTLPGTGRIHPRKSFDLWQEAVRGHSKRWQSIDVDMALELRRLLLERSEQIARKAFEIELRAEQNLSSDVLNAMAEGFLLLDRNFEVLRLNTVGARLTGKRREDVVGRSFWEVWPDAAPEYRSAMLTRSQATLERAIARPDGSTVWLDVRIYPTTDGLAAFFRDIGERKAMEAALRRMNETLEDRVSARTAELQQAHEQLRQSQKMEALGQLTGGIAHDFNNMLANIVSSMDLMRMKLAMGKTDDLERHLLTASHAIERAKALTQRMLSFARQQDLREERVDVNMLIRDLRDLLDQSVGSGLTVELQLSPKAWPVYCDPHQLENALLNLTINARDAMREGGRITIATGNETIGAVHAKAMDVPSGDYLCVCVCDTGAGMPDDVIARAFDPFFTTKPSGKGTGLGLSMIYGFVKQSGGTAQIESTLGKGTTVRLFFPRDQGVANRAAARSGVDPESSANGR